MQARKSLSRAAALLEALLVRIRKAAYPFAITSIEREARTIMLVSSNDEQLHESKLTPLPTDLASLQDHPELVKPICLHASGVEAMIYFCNVIKDILPGKPRSAMHLCIVLTEPDTCITEVELIPANSKIQISRGLGTACDESNVHLVWKVTFGSRELWAMDVAGAQHGHSDSLMPWSSFVKGRCTAINGEWSLGFCRNRPARESLPWLSPAVSTQVLALADALDQGIPQLLTGHGGSLRALLEGQGSTYQSTAQRLLGDLEARLPGILASLFTTSRPYHIKAVAGKGKGMFATRRIARGTRLLAEAPIFRVPRDELNLQKLEAAIAQSVGLLSQVQRESFFALHNFHGTRHSQALGIARTNALPLGSGASVGGIFLEASRINHSCRHNAQNTWNDSRGQVTIHVLRDVDDGEEITISYLGASENYAARQSRLQKSFGFVCACELCTLPAPQRTQSDRRLNRITYLDDQIGDGIRIVSTPLACLRMAHEMKLLMEEEGIADARIPRLYYDAIQIVIANGDEARARVFAERASVERLIMEGSDSAVVHRLNKYAANPSSHVQHGTSQQWRQRVNKIPQGLNEQDFEKWLWRLPT